MGVKSTYTITRAEADRRFVELYVQTRTAARRAKRQRLIDEAGGIDAIDAETYHRVDAKLREDRWRTDASDAAKVMDDDDMEHRLERLNDEANGGEGFENYIISDHPAD